MAFLESNVGPFGYSTTAEERYYMYPERAIRNNLRGVIFCHPWNGSAFGTFGSEYQQPFITKLANHMVVVASDLGDPAVSLDGHNSWGSANGVLRVHQDRDFLINSMNCKPEVILIGMSHGGSLAFQYAKQYPANVKAIIGLEPAVRLQSVRTYDPGLATSMDKCLGTWSTTVDQTYSATLYAGSLNPNTPMRIYYATDDPIIDPASVLGFQGNRPQTEIKSIQKLTGLTTVSHNDAVVGLCETDMIRWCLNFAL